MLSICIATYNGEKFIKEQLKSILNQISEDDEIIISDDGSTDNTIDIIRGLKDKRINILQTDTSLKSPIFNFERAIKNANGQFIFLSDQDDIWVDNKVKIIMKQLEKYKLVFSNAAVVDENLQILKERLLTEFKSKTGLFTNLLSNNYTGSTMAFHRDILVKAIPFPKFIPMHDQWLGVIAEYYFSTYYIDEPLILYRRHGNNASYSGESSQFNYIKRVGFRIRIISALILRVFKWI